MVQIYVLRYGHRPGRDKRITTHVGLVARAFGAHGFILGGVPDEGVINSLRKVIKTWGGNLHIETGIDPYKYIVNWKRKGGIVVHLTMYGIPVDEVIDKVRKDNKDILVLVGAEKVPRYFYELADYNIAIGNQPHSEVAALAIFLDRFYNGRELYISFPNAKIIIVPSARGKRVVRVAKENGKDE
ncbi:MAG: tRNA (cytidine(56)-2'-O)-methyltransferase [Thermoprotei archaeon]|nr:MAG: tRNA (cytidine(56)-2'-O)-methyltransferase [Thermoprotei archaeon]